MTRIPRYHERHEAVTEPLPVAEPERTWLESLPLRTRILLLTFFASALLYEVAPAALAWAWGAMLFVILAHGTYRLARWIWRGI